MEPPGADKAGMPRVTKLEKRRIDIEGGFMLRRTLSGLLFYALSGALLAHAGQFLEAPQYPTGTNPQSVAVGDFNGDGNLDLAIANSTSNTVSVLLGKGDGTFSPKVDYATGNTPQGVAVGDFNGDGHLDLAVTSSASNTISVFLGNGDGTFKAKVDYATGRQPQGVATGDFNGDGHLDLVVTNAFDGKVGVLLGKGDGTFNAEVTYITGFNPYAVVVGDFNGDGILDLAVANNNNNNVVSVFLGKGDGTFQTQLQYTTGNTPVSIALADFNGDGHLDIAVADQQGDAVSILLGDGKGGFATHVEYPTGAFPTAVTVGDFNGDGKPDLAVSGGNGNTITVLWGTGDGTFQGQVNCGTGDIPYSVVAGDFNSDGNLDLVVANSGGNSVSVVLNNGNETFQARADYAAGPNPYSVATADFNGDGFLDLAVATSDCPVFPGCGPGSISILLGNGDGTFQGPSHYSTGTNTDPYSVAVGDFNGDKIPDLAVANYATNTVSVLLGVGDGTFQTHVDYPVGSEPASVAVGDFNADGKLDLVVANFHSNTVSVLLGNGDGTFKSAVNYNVGHGPVSVAVADFNGDHKLDLVVVNETDNNASVLLGNGDGTFKAQVAYPTGVGGNPLSVVVGDFNGDHNLDLAVADFQTQQVSVLLGNGDGTFQPVKPYPTGANPSSIVIADFNGDGKLDLALTSTPLGSSPGNLVSVLLGNGDGTFGPPALFGAGYLSYSATVGDFNGDGALDLAVANGASNTVSVLLNTRGTAMNVLSSGNPSAFGQSVTFTTTVAASVSNGAAPTGTVTLKNGSTVIKSGALVGGKFAVSTTTLPVGSDLLSSVYSGDANYQPHTVALTQTVQLAGTSTVLISSANPSNLNQSITFTATVTSNTTGEPTGTVTWLDGKNSIGSSTVNGNGVATFPMSTLTVGTHNITAAYLGDSNFNASTSPVLSQVVQPGNTSTALTSSANPSTESQSVTLTATVSSGTGTTPTGSVKFMDGTTLLGTSALNANGIAAFSTTTLSVGTHNITAVYGGDNNFGTSTSPLLSQVVQKATTSTAVSSSLNPSTVNQSVTFTAKLSWSVTGTPTGTVTWLDGTNPIGSSAVNGSGVATFPISTLTVGTHSITAAYLGDSNFNASTSPLLSEVVQQSNTSTAVSSSANPSTESQSVIFTATVSSGTGTTPTGSVKFMDGTIPLGTSTLNASGIAAFSTTTLSVGTHNITAVYNGDANSDPSTSTALSQVVQKANTSTALSSSPTAANLNQAVTFTATVTPGTVGSPTGTVSFLDGTTQLGVSTLSGSGVATFSISTLTAGTHSITAAYAGDGNFNSSTSSVVSLPVNAPDFSLSSSALSPSSVAPGASAKAAITITPLNGLSPSGVALTCSVSPSVSPAATCSLGTISVANNVGTSTLTVASVGPQSALAPPTKGGRSGTLFALGLMIPAVLLSGAGLNKPGRRKLFSVCLLFLVLGGCLLQVACGGGVSTPTKVSSPETPAGTYSVTITGNGSGAQHTTSVSFTVQ
jgi:hypothetical protein